MKHPVMLFVMVAAAATIGIMIARSDAADVFLADFYDGLRQVYRYVSYHLR